MSPADADLLMEYLAGHLTDRETTRVQSRLQSEPPLADAYIRLARDEATLADWSVSQQAPVPPTRSRRPLFAGATVTAAVLVGGLAIFLATRRPVLIEGAPALAAGARVVSVRGEANLITPDGPVPVTVGQVIRPGDRLQTGADGEAVVTLPGEARVEVRNDTDVRIMPPDGDSRVAIEAGSVRTEAPHGDLDPMTVTTPHAVIRAAAALTSVALGGTTVTAEATPTRMTRTSDNQSLDLPTGQTVSTGNGFAPMVVTRPRETYRFTSGAVIRAAVSADGYLAVCTSDARVVLRNLATGQSPVDRKLIWHRVGGLAFSADGDWVVATVDGWTARVRDGHTGKARSATRKGRTEIRAVALSPDGAWLATGGRLFKGTADVRIHEAATGKESRVLTAGGSVNAVAFSPDGKTLAVAGTDSTVRYWETSAWKSRGEPVSLPAEGLALTFSPDGKTLAVGGRDGLVRLLSLGAGGPVIDLDLPGTNVAALTYSPDGHDLAVAGGDTVWVWDVAARRTKQTIAAHRDRVNSVAYTPDGKTLVTAGSDGLVKMWDVE